MSVAQFELDGGIDDLMQGLNDLQMEVIAPEMLQAGEPILERNVVRRASSHHASGDMIGSIKPTRTIHKNDGYSIIVRPTGKDAKGVRNMEKMAYLEYGTSKQTATPVLTPAVGESEDPVCEAIQKKFDDLTKEMAL